MESLEDKNSAARLRTARIRNKQSAEQLYTGIRKGSTKELSISITLLESDKVEDQEVAARLIDMCLPHSGHAIRIGISGVPGVGKSSFIETFGTLLTTEGKKISVLAIDPSSHISGGSILGDKTRMNALSQNQNAFIRPTPSSGKLGGVAQKTREAIVLCEAAGYDIILIETVGVGQSEIAVKSMVDFFLLLMLSGAGDELQGIKRGIIEIADALIITKADGDNIQPAKLAAATYKNALHLFPPTPNGWIPRVATCSIINEEGIQEIWEMIQSFHNTMQLNGHLALERKRQAIYWMHEKIKRDLFEHFYHLPQIKGRLAELEKLVESNKLSPTAAAQELINNFIEP